MTHMGTLSIIVMLGDFFKGTYLKKKRAWRDVKYTSAKGVEKMPYGKNFACSTFLAYQGDYWGISWLQDISMAWKYGRQKGTTIF